MQAEYGPPLQYHLASGGADQGSKGSTSVLDTLGNSLMPDPHGPGVTPLNPPAEWMHPGTGA